MEKLLQQAQELVIALNHELNEVRQKNAECNQLAAKLRIDRTQLDEQMSGIVSREKNLISSESAISALKEARSLQAEGRASQVIINDKQAHLERARDEFLRLKAQHHAELESARAEIAREREDFKRLKEELKEKERTLKDQILNEIKNKLK